MTQFRYFVARFGQMFGISLTGRYASNAAAETHLLREAEEVLGRLAWQKVEEIEEISVEYWNLRKLHKDYLELSGRIDDANEVLHRSHEARAGMLEKVVDDTKDLVSEREQLIEKTERLAAERDVILHEARLVKRRHDGIKAKLEVLAAEGSSSPELVESSKAQLAGLKEQFRELRAKRDALAGRIESLDGQVDALDVRIEARRGEMREEALDSYQDIGKANRDISQSRAELGLLENEMIELYCEIGRYLSIHANHPGCAAAVRAHRSLVGQMMALRTSITLNNRLSGREIPQATG